MNYSGKNINLKKVENEVIVEVNMKKKTIKFIIDGDDKIVAYTNIAVDKPLFPVVSYILKMILLRLLNAEFLINIFII